jgi:hypothetical protein
MASMRKLPCFGEKPRGVRWIRCSDERKRAPEPIGDLLVVPLISVQTASAPRPLRWQLPSCDVRRQVRQRLDGSTLLRAHAIAG